VIRELPVSVGRIEFEVKNTEIGNFTILGYKKPDNNPSLTPQRASYLLVDILFAAQESNTQRDEATQSRADA